MPTELPPAASVRVEAAFKAGALHAPASTRFWLDVLLPTARLPPEHDALVRRIFKRGGVSVFDFVPPLPSHAHHSRHALPQIAVPLAPCDLRNHPIEADDTAWVTSEIDSLLATGAVVRWAAPRPPVKVLPLGVVHQTTKRRLILDGRSTNASTPSPPMKYQSLSELQRGLRHGDFLFSIDHKSGYHHVFLTEDSFTYFGFRWMGVLYVFRVLPFGWAPAPFVYDLLSSVVSAFIGSLGIYNIHYLDDFGFRIPASASPATRRWMVFIVLQVFFRAGYFLSTSKSVLEPATSIDLLGFTLDTARQLFAVPARKLVAVRALLDELVGPASAPLAPHTAPLKLVQRTVGKIQSLSLAAPPLPIFLRAAHEAIANADRANSSRVLLDAATTADLQCLRALDTWDGLARWPSERHSSMVLVTDASADGWGGYLLDGTACHDLADAFPRMLAPVGIHVKELLAIQYSLRHIQHLVHDTRLDIFTDNMIVQHTLLNGRALDPTMREFSRQLLAFQLDNNVIIRAHRIATEANNRADWLSRLQFRVPLVIDRGDHHLNPAYFARLQGLCHRPFTIDACANRYNRQCARYISLGCDAHDPPVADSVFMYLFPAAAREYAYVNPPFALIHPVWSHLRACRASGVLLAPRTPTKPWFTDIIAAASRVVVLAAKGTPDVFFQPSKAYSASIGPIRWDLLAVFFDFSADC